MSKKIKVEINDRFITGGKTLIVNDKIDNGVFRCNFENESNSFTVMEKSFANLERVSLPNNTVRRKRNLVSLINVCLNVLKSNQNSSLTATEIYKIVKEQNLFNFSEKAKTPANTIHARIREYMKKYGDNSVVQYDENGHGKFRYKIN